jgi:hypothetical protein
MRIHWMIVIGAWAVAAMAQTLPSYDVYRAPSRIAIDGRLNERARRQAPPVGQFHIKWW